MSNLRLFLQQQFRKCFELKFSSRLINMDAKELASHSLIMEMSFRSLARLNGNAAYDTFYVYPKNKIII